MAGSEVSEVSSRIYHMADNNISSVYKRMQVIHHYLTIKNDIAKEPPIFRLKHKPQKNT